MAALVNLFEAAVEMVRENDEGQGSWTAVLVGLFGLEPMWQKMMICDSLMAAFDVADLMNVGS